MKSLFDHGFFPDTEKDVFENEFLNDFIALGKNQTNQIRLIIQKELSTPSSRLKKEFQWHAHHISDVTLHLPIRVGDFTDFYSSKAHATNVGRIFRPQQDPLIENWNHMPIAYHARSSSIIVSNTNIKLPSGQIKNGNKIEFSSSKKVDFELEMATIIGKENNLGHPINVNEAEEFIFGFCLLNDWSARDIQSWEYKPLGPFLGKNFATTISPWIVTIEALKDFKTEIPQKKHMEYLQQRSPFSFNINLEAYVNETLVTQTNFSHLYWTVCQQIAHHTVNGCNLKIGDVLGSGTISDENNAKGSLLELTNNGKEPLIIKNKTITFLEKDDRVTLKGFAQKNGKRVGFGEATGKLTM